jgi:large subunit ribosomal protein L5
LSKDAPATPKTEAPKGAKPAAAPAPAAKPAAPKPAAPQAKPAQSAPGPKKDTPPKAPKVAPAAKPARRMDNAMQNPRIAKVTVNIGVGEGGEKLQKAEKVLAKLTGHKPVRTLGKVMNRELGVKQGDPLGCKVTLRGPDAEKFVSRALYTRKNKVYDYSFDNQGNLQFGVADYTNFEGERYDPDIGVFGMDVCITLEKAGHRIKHRRTMARSVPPAHRVSRDEAKAFLSQKFAIEVV